MKGFKLDVQMSVIANLKTSIMKLLHCEQKELSHFALLIAPMFLLVVNGNIDILFNDWEQVLMYPMFENLNVKFQ